MPVPEHVCVAEALWDAQADTFDDEPDHGLADPGTRAAWRALLLEHLPPAPAAVTDLGCGTGTLSVLLAEEGYDVRGLDVSGQMVERARRKARDAGLAVPFARGDASAPPYDAQSCDAVLVRHVLWALPDPHAALARWVDLLAPGGRLVLVEGQWGTGAGLTVQECVELVRGHRETAEVRRLPESVYWGAPVDDERYLVVSTR